MADPARPAPDEVDFDQTIEEALDSLTPDLREFMSNVAIVVEEEPPPGVPLLGLYQGFPLTTRGLPTRGCLRTRSRSTGVRSSVSTAPIQLGCVARLGALSYTRWRTTSASATSVSSRSVATNSCS